MDALNKFLENLKPGGASNLPKSKFEQTLTDDSEVDSPEPQEPTIKTDINKPSNEIELKKEVPPKPRKGLVKQLADVHHESLEIEENSNNNNSKPVEEIKIAPNPLPRKKKIPKINEPENESVEKLWQDLNVGKNGFLTVTELEKVCNYLGMNTPDQKSLKSLFSVIDTDSDGRVSLVEFAAGLKKYGNIEKISNLNLSGSSISGLFTCIDPNRQGFCEAQKVVELWASGGILNGNEVLDYLEFTINEPVNLNALSKALEQEIINENLDAITLAAIITYQKELYYFRNQQIENPGASLTAHQQAVHETLLLKSGELQNNLDKLTEELSYIAHENESLKGHVKELEEINRHQIEELDAVAELHRKNQDSQSIQIDKEIERSLFLSTNTIKNLEKDLSLRIHECEILTKTMENQKQIIENQQKAIEILSIESTDEKKQIKIEPGNEELCDIALMKNLQLENNNLKQKIKSLNAKIEIAINRERQYQIKLREMEVTAKDFRVTEENLNKNLNELSKENNEKKKKINFFSEKIDDLEKENTFLLKSIQSLEEERENEKRDFFFEKENLRKSCHSLGSQLSKSHLMQTQLESSIMEIQSKSSIIRKLEEANDRLAISVRNALSKIELLSRSDVEMNPKQLIKENLQIQKENILLEDQINQLKRKVDITGTSQQLQDLNKQIDGLQFEIKKKNIKIDELEENLRKLQRGSPNSSSSQKKSFRKFDHLQFKYDELRKKYETQMAQVEKTDSLLKELYETNTNLLKSLKRMEELKDKSDLTVIQLEEKVQNLQNVLKNN